MTNEPPMIDEQSAATLREHLHDLDAELALARLAGLIDDETYMTDLALEIAATEAAYVGAAVTQIAVLRAELDGPLAG